VGRGRVRGLAGVVARARARGSAPGRTVARLVALRAVGGFGGDEALVCGLLDPGVPLRDARLYSSKRTTLRAQRRVNAPDAMPATEDKVLFAELARERGIAIPRTVAVLPARGLRAMVDGRAALARTLAADPAAEMVAKPARGFHGRGVRMVSRDGDRLVVDGTPLEPEAAVDALALEDDRMLVQERVRDHPALQAINRTEAAQTVRLVTLIERALPAVVLCLVKLPRADAVTDNLVGGRSGGRHALVDPADGRLTALFAPRPDGSGFARLPDDDLTTGITLPLWGDVRELGSRAALAVPRLGTVGWDIAISADGPVVLEGNARWDPAPLPGGAVIARRVRRAKTPQRSRCN
jgi:hypothetical protein